MKAAPLARSRQVRIFCAATVVGILLTGTGCRTNRSTADVQCTGVAPHSRFRGELLRAGKWNFNPHDVGFGRELVHYQLDSAVPPRFGARVPGASVTVLGHPASGGYILNTGVLLIVELTRFEGPMDVNDVYQIRENNGCEDVASP